MIDRIAMGKELCRITERLPRRLWFPVSNGPEEYSTLLASTVTGMPVFMGASDTSIFYNPWGNILQRAVHDTLHLALQCNFTLEGEYRVAVEQSRLYGQWSSLAAEVMFADLRGQALYFDYHKEFPVDQIGFVYHWLVTKDVTRRF